jgi:hypothetical protein
MTDDFEKAIIQDILRETKELIQMVYTLKEEVNSLKASSSIRKNIFFKVITALLITFSLASFTWVGDRLYKAPSPSQQNILQKIEQQIRTHHPAR